MPLTKVNGQMLDGAINVDSNGNVGIGTTSVTGGYKAQINGNLLLGTTANPIITGTTSLTLYGDNSASSGMRISSSGAVGINNTPQTWFATETALQIGYGACFAGRTNQFDEVNIYSNAYTTASGNTAYIGSSTATYYQMSGGLHRWFNATSGSAGAPCSFTERMRIASNGDVLVGVTSWSPTVAGLRFDGPSSAQGRILSTCNNDYNIELYGSQVQRIGFGASNSSTRVGSITVNTTNTAYNTSSDYRLKENIAPMTGALAKVAQLKPCTYTWKVDGSAGQGFIAHELQEVVPDAVTGEKDAVEEDGSIKPQQIDTSFLVATLTAAIQELNAKVEAQAAEIAALKAK